MRRRQISKVEPDPAPTALDGDVREFAEMVQETIDAKPHFAAAPSDELVQLLGEGFVAFGNHLIEPTEKDDVESLLAVQVVLAILIRRAVKRERRTSGTH